MCGASWCGSPCGVAAAVWVGAAVGVLPWPISLAIEFGSKLRDGLGLLRRRLLRPFGRRIDEFWPHGRLNRRFLDGEPSAGRGGGWGRSGGIGSGSRRRRRIRFGRRRGFWRRSSRLLAAGVGGGGAVSGLGGGVGAGCGGAALRSAQIRGRGRRRGRGLRRGFGVLFAVGDLIEFAQRNGFNRNRFRSVREFAGPRRSRAGAAPATPRAALWSPRNSNMTAVLPTPLPAIV